jgi:glycosyltransferase involved in cell wall biosynthesis
MHILYFHQHFSTPKGSAGLRSYEMALALIRHGHRVSMVCGKYSLGNTGLDSEFRNGVREGFVDGIHVIEFNLAYSNHDGFMRRSWAFLKFAIGSARIALTQEYDILFATTTPLTAGIPGILARWLRRKTFVFEVRDLWPELPRAMGVIRNPIILALMSALEWVSYRSAHRCIGLSQGISNGIAKRGVARKVIETIPNGCDIALFSSSTNTSWRPDGVAPSDLMAVFAGTHGMANGLDAVIDAALVLKKRGRQDIKIVLIGDGKEKSQLINRAKGLEAVIFLEPVSKDKLAGLLASSDLGIQCLANIPEFYFGTSPNKFFDYLSCGLPVLTNYPGWVAQLIEENQCGFAVPPENAELFADALELAAKDPASLKAMGIQSYDLARRQFSRETLSENWVQWVIGTEQ